MIKSSFEGIKVLDFARVLAAPLVATLLADFGAEVIKIELPKSRDPKDKRTDLFFKLFNRNKKCITLDLHKPEGQEIAKKLCEKADVALFNFRPGVLERFNMSPETLLQVNPNLILCLVSAYGQTGPYNHKPGYDRTVSAFSGLTDNSGYPEHPPVRTGYPLIDYMTGFLGAYSITLALFNRDVNNGGGEIIDLSLAETALRTTGSALTAYGKAGIIQKRAGNRISFVVPAENFETKDGRFIAMNANSNKIWRRLCLCMDREDLLISEEFEKNQKRLINQDKLYKIIGDWIINYNAKEIQELFDKAEVPCELVRNIGEVAEDPHLIFREAVMNFEDPEFGELIMPGIVPKLKNFPGKVIHLASNIGEFNQQIYKELLGFSEEKINELKEKGII